MDRPLLKRLGGSRRIVLGALSGASLWAAVVLAPAGLSQHVGALREVAAGRLWQTTWTWPLAATATFAILTSQSARRRWPQPSRRTGLGFAGAAGIIGLAVLTVTVRPGIVLLMFGGLLLLGLLAAWVLLVPTRLAPPLPTEVLERLSDTDRLEKSDARLKLQNDLRATALQAIAGLAVLAGAALGFQQLTEDRQQAVADRELSRQGQASERFTRAISQLGSDRREVQLGGIYGLEQIAQQAPANRLAVTEVLVAYLHRRVPQPPEPVSPPWDELRVRAPDVQAALTVLARRHSESHDPPLDLQALDLRSADLPRSNLSRVNLAGGNLSGAELLLANLAGAMVPGTDLTQARLHGANLSKATVNDSKLAFANLHRANLSSAYLYNASLRHALLSRADLSNADLSMANLSDAKLVHTNLHNALLSATLFIRADLRGADLRGVDVTGGDFRKAEANASTRWPVGFDWRREKVRMFS